MASERLPCKSTAGVFQPWIDLARCEGKADCLRVCPVNVFDVRRLTPEEKATRTTLTRLKLWFHGGKQAFAVHAERCEACGLCVQACPEKAITLERVSG